MPITSIDDWKLDKLTAFAQMVERWCAKYPKSGLSYQTSIAVSQTLTTLVDLARHLLENFEFKYVMLGKFSSDAIEGRFGWYRQSCGGSYFISVRQILTSEKKIRVLSLMRSIQCAESDDREGLLSSALRIFKQSASDQNIPDEKTENHDSEWLSDRLCDLSLEDMDSEDLPIIYRVAGYVGRTVARRRRCNDCHNLLLMSEQPTDNQQCFPSVSSIASEGEVNSAIELFENVDRGGLYHPRECVVVICAIAYYYMQLIEDDIETYNLFKCRDFQRSVFIEMILSKIRSSSVACLCDLKCENQHNVTPNILFCIFNCFSKSSLKRAYECTDDVGADRKLRKLQSMD